MLPSLRPRGSDGRARIKSSTQDRREPQNDPLGKRKKPVKQTPPKARNQRRKTAKSASSKPQQRPQSSRRRAASKKYTRSSNKQGIKAVGAPEEDRQRHAQPPKTFISRATQTSPDEQQQVIQVSRKYSKILLLVSKLTKAKSDLHEPADIDLVVYPRSRASVETIGDDEMPRSTNQNTDANTIKSQTYRAEYIPQKLARRGIEQTESEEEDERLVDFKAMLTTEPLPASKSIASQIKTAIDVFTQGVTYKDNDIRDEITLHFFPLLNTLLMSIDKAKSEAGYPIIPKQYFDHMKLKCAGGNEAELQRSIMVNVFHPYWIRETFDWSCEKQWYDPKPNREFNIHEHFRKDPLLDAAFPRPKPDLVISFNSDAFAQHVKPMPWSPEATLILSGSPEGYKATSRIFPFLIMEVKKQRQALEEAEESNIRTASWALLNMYHWMNDAGMADAFFKKVRVFTMVFNADSLGIRVHRAVRSQGELFFKFSTVFAQHQYNSESICMLVSGILESYAKQDLWKALLRAVQKLHKVPVDSDSPNDGGSRLEGPDRDAQTPNQAAYGDTGGPEGFENTPQQHGHASRGDHRDFRNSDEGIQLQDQAADDDNDAAEDSDNRHYAQTQTRSHKKRGSVLAQDGSPKAAKAAKTDQRRTNGGRGVRSTRARTRHATEAGQHTGVSFETNRLDLHRQSN